MYRRHPSRHIIHRLLSLAVVLSMQATAVQPVLAAPAPASVILQVNNRDSLLNDVNHNGRADAGDTLRYTVVIDNLGTADAEDVQFQSQLESYVTLVPGSVNTSPVTPDQNLTGLEDVPVPVIVPDADADGNPLTVTITTNPTQGTVTGAAPNLTYTPNPDFNGTDFFQVQSCDTFTPPVCATSTIRITLAPVNDAPTFTAAGDVNVDEDAPAQTVSGWASSILPGPADEAAQTVTFNITANDNPALFSAGPALSSSGDLTFTPVADSTGEANITVSLQDDGGVADGGLDISAPVSFKITIVNINDAPILADASFTLPENSPNGTTVGALSFSDADSGQSHTFSITAGDPGGAFTIDATGTILVNTTSLLNYETTSSFLLTVRVTDDGTGSLFDETDIPITLTDVNETPQVSTAVFSILEYTANDTSLGFVTASDPDSGQSLTYAITAGNTSGAFAINAATGELTVANSTALDVAVNPTFGLTVEATDDAVPPLSGSATITVNLNNVNDAPDIADDSFSLGELSPAGYEVGTVSVIDADASDFHTFSITAGNTADAFIISPAGGVITVASANVLDFETTPTYNLTVHVVDDGVPALSDDAAITINITNENDAPLVQTDAFAIDERSPVGTAVGTVLFTDSDTADTHTFSITAGNTDGAFAIDASSGAITVANSTPLAFLTNPSFALTVTVTDDGSPAASDSATITITLNDVNDPPTALADTFDTIGNTLLQVAATDTATGPHIFYAGNLLTNDTDAEGDIPLTAEFIAADAGAVVTVEEDGSFTFVPPAGATGTASFTYKAIDALGGESLPGTVTINLVSSVWYVKNDAAVTGTGRSTDPFQTTAELAALPQTGDTIYVYRGDGTANGYSTGITLLDNQRLIGGAGVLDLPVAVNGGANPTVLQPAGQATLLGQNTSGSAAVQVGANATLRGLNILGNSGSVAVRGAAIGSLTIENSQINTAGSALDLANGTLTATLSALNTAGGVNAINLNLVNGTLTSPLGTLTGASGSTVKITGGAINFSFDGSLNQANNAALLEVTGGHTGTLRFGTGSVTASSGTGLQFNGGNGTYQFEGPFTLAGGDAGVDITASSGSFTFPAGATIISPSGPAFLVTGGSCTITYPGLVTKSSSGNLISITSQSGGTITFSGDLTAIGAASGIRLDGNNTAGIIFSGANINLSTGTRRAVDMSNMGSTPVTFSGGRLIINTTTGNGLTAQGGTLAVTGADNTIISGTGTALSLSNTTIAPDGLTFKTITASGANNGISLQNTGTAAGLTVTGTGTPGSGGAIQNTTGAAVSLTNTGSISLAWMTLAGSDSHGIYGSTVRGLSLVDSQVLDAGDAIGEHGINLNNASGNLVFQRDTISNPFENGFQIVNTAGTVDQLTLVDNAFVNVAAPKGNGILISAPAGSSTVFNRVDIMGNATPDPMLISNYMTGVNIRLGGSARINRLEMAYLNLMGNNTAFNSRTDQTAQNHFLVHDNTMVGHYGQVNFLNFGANASLQEGFFTNNIVSVITDIYAIGVNAVNEGNGTLTLAVNGNQINGFGDTGLNLESRGGTGHANFLAQNNTLTAGANAFSSIYARTGSGTASDSNELCLDLLNNVAPAPVSTAQLYIDRILTADATVLSMPGLVPSPANAAGVQAYMAVRNPAMTGMIYVEEDEYLSGTCATPSIAAVLPEGIQVAGASRGGGLASLRSDLLPRPLAQGELISLNLGTLAAGAAITITYDAVINDPLPATVRQISNQAVVSGSNFTPVNSNDPDTTTPNDATITRVGAAPVTSETGADSLPAKLPATGFAPNRASTVPVQPAEKAYQDLGSLWLEIPDLNLKAAITGVPVVDGDWDLTWLGKQIGYLNGTAYPTWSGNTALTAHVYDANGKPGPFANLGTLRWGQKVILHAWGSAYEYEIRSVDSSVDPGKTNVLKHEEKSWLTLITCRGYDESEEQYRWRTVVRAVLLKITPE